MRRSRRSRAAAAAWSAVFMVILAPGALAAPPPGVPAGDARGTVRRLPLPEDPLVIAHRGASGYLPEHTLEAYELAIDLGADYIEPDLVMTRDGHLVARHDNVLDLTTDVADHPEFAGRKTTKVIDGVSVTGWFSEDFTLAELETLRAVERIPEVRPENARFDGLYGIPTLEEIIDLVRRKEKELGRRIGIYPETKHPTHFASVGLDMSSELVRVLRRNGYRSASDPVLIQSFEVTNLRQLDTMTDIRLVQLLGASLMPYDVYVAGGTLTYAEMATPAGLAEIATYADGVGPDKSLVIPLDAAGELHAENATGLVDAAHAVGLAVHPWTFRAENAFLPANFRSSADPLELGDLAGEIEVFLEAGVDGFFTDHTDVGVEAAAG